MSYPRVSSIASLTLRTTFVILRGHYSARTSCVSREGAHEAKPLLQASLKFSGGVAALFSFQPDAGRCSTKRARTPPTLQESKLHFIVDLLYRSPISRLFSSIPRNLLFSTLFLNTDVGHPGHSPRALYQTTSCFLQTLSLASPAQRRRVVDAGCLPACAAGVIARTGGYMCCVLFVVYNSPAISCFD
jgi:hypothetical protein